MDDDNVSKLSVKDQCIAAAKMAMQVTDTRNLEADPAQWARVDYESLATAAYTAIMEILKEPDQDMLDIAPVPDDFAKEIWQAMLSAVGEG